MNLSILPSNLPIPKNDGGCEHLLNLSVPDISLQNQDGNYLALNRNETFRIVLYCYPMTGHPNKPLPPNWNNKMSRVRIPIPGSKDEIPEDVAIFNVKIKETKKMVLADLTDDIAEKEGFDSVNDLQRGIKTKLQTIYEQKEEIRSE